MGAASHVMAVIEGNGAERHFAVRDLGGRGALVNTTSRYRGTTFLPVRAGASTLRLEVKAVGPWQVRLADVADAGSLSHGDTTEGSGDAVLIYDGPGGVAHVAGNSDGRFFAIQAVPRGLSRGKSIVNTTDEYTGSVLCPPGPLLLVIRAQGDWSIGVT